MLCGAGFELPSEALFLGKKTLVIPMKGHYEQTCNALGAAEVGATTIAALDLIYHRQINYWLGQEKQAPLLYADQTEQMLIDVLARFEKEGKVGYQPSESFDTWKQKLGLLRYFF